MAPKPGGDVPLWNWFKQDPLKEQHNRELRKRKRPEKDDAEEEAEDKDYEPSPKKLVIKDTPRASASKGKNNPQSALQTPKPDAAGPRPGKAKSHHSLRAAAVASGSHLPTPGTSVPRSQASHHLGRLGTKQTTPSHVHRDARERGARMASIESDEMSSPRLSKNLFGERGVFHRPQTTEEDNLFDARTSSTRSKVKYEASIEEILPPTRRNGPNSSAHRVAQERSIGSRPARTRSEEDFPPSSRESTMSRQWPSRDASTDASRGSTPEVMAALLLRSSRTLSPNSQSPSKLAREADSVEYKPPQAERLNPQSQSQASGSGSRHIEAADEEKNSDPEDVRDIGKVRMEIHLLSLPRSSSFPSPSPSPPSKAQLPSPQPIQRQGDDAEAEPSSEAGEEEEGLQPLPRPVTQDARRSRVLHLESSLTEMASSSDRELSPPPPHRPSSPNTEKPSSPPRQAVRAVIVKKHKKPAVRQFVPSSQSQYLAGPSPVRPRYYNALKQIGDDEEEEWNPTIPRSDEFQETSQENEIELSMDLSPEEQGIYPLRYPKFLREGEEEEILPVALPPPENFSVADGSDLPPSSAPIESYLSAPELADNGGINWELELPDPTDSQLEDQWYPEVPRHDTQFDWDAAPGSPIPLSPTSPIRKAPMPLPTPSSLPPASSFHMPSSSYYSLISSPAHPTIGRDIPSSIANALEESQPSFLKEPIPVWTPTRIDRVKDKARQLNSDDGEDEPFHSSPSTLSKKSPCRRTSPTKALPSESSTLGKRMLSPAPLPSSEAMRVDGAPLSILSSEEGHARYSEGDSQLSIVKGFREMESFPQSCMP